MTYLCGTLYKINGNGYDIMVSYTIKPLSPKFYFHTTIVFHHNIKIDYMLLSFSCINGSVLSAYYTITSFKNLEKLSLEISLLMDGLVLKDIFIKCEKLKSLRLKCASPNEKFMVNLCHVLKYATSLRDLR